MKTAFLVLVAFMVTGISYAQTMGEGVACITWPNGVGPYSCASGLTCAAAGPGDLTGICLDLRNDSMNCGRIYLVCASGNICAGGVCVSSDPMNDPDQATMPPLLSFRMKPQKIELP